MSTNRNEIIAAAREAASSLKVSYIDAKPQNYDFGENRWIDDEPTWEFLEPAECDDCGRTIVDGEDHGYVDSDGNAVEMPGGLDPEDYAAEEWADEHGLERCPREGDDFREFSSAEGPMMNYRYPIDSDVFDADHARKLADVALCLVQFDGDDTYLALTGGGMDMSWDICEAYVALGFLPPTHFKLPRMAGYELSEKHATVLAAVERANQIQINWATSGLTDAKNMLDTLPLPGERAPA